MKLVFFVMSVVGLAMMAAHDAPGWAFGVVVCLYGWIGFVTERRRP